MSGKNNKYMHNTHTHAHTHIHFFFFFYDVCNLYFLLDEMKYKFKILYNRWNFFVLQKFIKFSE